MSRLHDAIEALNQAIDSGYEFLDAIDLVLERYSEFSPHELAEGYENQ